MAKRKKKKLRYIIIGGVVLLLAGLILKPKEQQLAEVTVEKASVRDITSIVTATGTVKPEIEVKISSEVPGEIVRLPVKEGDRVKKGDLLVSIDTKLLLSQVRQQEAGIETAKARAEEIRVQLLRAQQVLEDQQRLFADRFASEDALRTAQASASALGASHDAALAQIKQQEMQLDEARETLSKASIYSPMDGIVSALSAELGERVVGTGQFEGTEIMRVANLSVMELVTEVNETDVVNVTLGDHARILLDSMPNQVFTGKVTEIASSARKRETREEAVVFEVTVRFDEPSERIRPGMTATADIETESVAAALAVPLQSVTVREKQVVAKALGREVEASTAVESNQFVVSKDRERTREERENLQRIVWVFEDGTVKLREVQTGISDARYMQILSGVREGEQIVSGSYNAIARELEHDKAARVKQPDEDKKKK